jgi:hypothetical protein
VKGVNISVREVKDKIRKLKVDGASGPDGIGPQLLKNVIDEIAPPLATIMKKSQKEGAVPEDWRTANVTPHLQKGTESGSGQLPASLANFC